MFSRAAGHRAHLVRNLLFNRRMVHFIRRVLVVVGACPVPLFSAAPALARFVTPSPHVRPLSLEMRDFVRDAAERSPSARALLAQIEESDLVVYVRMQPFETTTIDGRTALVAAAAGIRYLVVELACGRSQLVQMAKLGHELRHAMEVADEPSVVNAGTLAAFYSKIGMQMEGSSGRHLTFETGAAGESGRSPLLPKPRHPRLEGWPRAARSFPSQMM